MTGRPKRTPKTIKELEEEETQRKQMKDEKAERSGKAVVPTEVGEGREISKSPRPGADS